MGTDKKTFEAKHAHDVIRRYAHAPFESYNDELSERCSPVVRSSDLFSSSARNSTATRYHTEPQRDQESSFEDEGELDGFNEKLLDIIKRSHKDLPVTFNKQQKRKQPPDDSDNDLALSSKKSRKAATSVNPSSRVCRGTNLSLKHPSDTKVDAVELHVAGPPPRPTNLSRCFLPNASTCSRPTPVVKKAISTHRSTSMRTARALFAVLLKDRPTSLEGRKAHFLATPSPTLRSATRRFVQEIYTTLPANCKEDACWLYTKQIPWYRKGTISKRFSWDCGDHRLTVHFGILALQDRGKLTAKHMKGWVESNWHLSHLCGNWVCCNPEHFTVEPGGINVNRNQCFRKLYGCRHSPPCMKTLKLKRLPVNLSERPHKDVKRQNYTLEEIARRRAWAYPSSNSNIQEDDSEVELPPTSTHNSARVKNTRKHIETKNARKHLKTNNAPKYISTGLLSDSDMEPIDSYMEQNDSPIKQSDSDMEQNDSRIEQDDSDMEPYDSE